MKDNFSEDALTYFIPKPQVGSHFHMPECHNLHVCPSACGRRNAIWALEDGEKDSVSFLNITEADVVSGNYENIVIDAAHELIEVLHPTPKAFMLYFKCIDDFLGTDEEALLSSLRSAFPTIRFAVCHIDPVRLDEADPPGMRLQQQMYSFLEYSGKKDASVNLIGMFDPLDKECELFTVLKGMGIRHFRNLYESRTFAEYLKMADSSLNLVFSRMGVPAAKDMFERLDIPFLYSPVTFGIDQVANQYQEIAALLGKDRPNLQEEITRASEAVEQTKLLLGDIPIAVDSSATMLPLAFGRVLINYGFNVFAIFPFHLRKADEEDCDWILKNSPDTQIIRSESYQTVLGYGFDRKCLAIGYNSGFTLQADHVVDVRREDTFFGFHGIRKMMSFIRNAYVSKYEW